MTDIPIIENSDQPPITAEITQNEPEEVGPDAAPQKKLRYIVTLLQSTDPNTWVSLPLIRNLICGMGDVIRTPRQDNEIDLWLDTGGGNIDAAYKLTQAIRGHASFYRVVIPDYAKSAGTLLAIGADEIVMGPSSELGPLDAQLTHPDREDITISALDMVGAMDHLLRTGIEAVVSGGAYVAKTTGLQRKEVLAATMGFVSGLMNPLISKLDPMLIHQAKNQLQVVDDYCRRLLADRKEKNQTDPRLLKLLDELPKVLTGNYHSHGFVITPGEARSIGLAIVDAQSYEYWEDAVRFCRAVHRAGKTAAFTIPDGEIRSLF